MIGGQERRTGGLLWLWVLLTILGTAILGVVIFTLFSRLIPVGKSGLTSSDVYDLTRSAVAGTGILAGAGGAVLAYRGQRVRERQHDLDLERQAGELLQRGFEQDREFRARYGDAAEHLGHDAAAVRLSGVFALGSLATDTDDVELRQSCVDVLCAYMRMPPRTRPGTIADASNGGQIPITAADEGDRQVRDSVQRLIAGHLQRGNERSRWTGVSVDLRGAHLVDADFSGAVFDGLAHFDEAVFLGTQSFEGAEFRAEASFAGAVFHGPGLFHSANFAADASFRRARFQNGLNLSHSGFAERFTFNGATVQGGANFNSTQFLGFAGLSHVTFDGAARFRRCVFGHDLHALKTQFMQTTSFRRADLHGVADFADAIFAEEPLFRGARAAVPIRARGATSPSAPPGTDVPTGVLPFRRTTEDSYPIPALERFLFWSVLPAWPEPGRKSR